MIHDNINTFDIESQAKKTLAYFSDFYQSNNNDWDYDTKLGTDKKRHLRILQPIKNIKVSRQDKHRNTNSQSFYKGRTPLVPSKVSLQNQKERSRKNLRTSCPRTSYFTITKQNYKPYKTIRNLYSNMKQSDDKEEEQGFDFMQYWVKHRFQDGAINTLVQKLKDNKNNTILRL